MMSLTSKAFPVSDEFNLPSTSEGVHIYHARTVINLRSLF